MFWGCRNTTLALEQSQAAAAVGQIRLARAYEEALAPHGINTAQVLVTLEDSANRRRYLNSRATLEQLLSLDVVPIVNENDTVATDEIRFGDNDRLAAQISVTVGADQLILLSDVDGFYSANPAEDPDATTIRRHRQPSRQKSKQWQGTRDQACQQGRHEDQTDGRQDCHGGRMRHGDHRRLWDEAAESIARGCKCHVVYRANRSASRAQALDRSDEATWFGNVGFRGGLRLFHGANRFYLPVLPRSPAPLTGATALPYLIRLDG